MHLIFQSTTLGTLYHAMYTQNTPHDGEGLCTIHSHQIGSSCSLVQWARDSNLFLKRWVPEGATPLLHVDYV